MRYRRVPELCVGMRRWLGRNAPLLEPQRSYYAVRCHGWWFGDYASLTAVSANAGPLG